MNPSTPAVLRGSLILAVSFFLMVGCQKDRAEAGGERPGGSDETASGPVLGSGALDGEAQGTAPADADAEDADKAFDPESIPLSTAALGDFPYFNLPAGYKTVSRNTKSFDFERFPFWTDNGYEWVEGKLQTGTFRTESGKEFSEVEVARNLEQLITSIGGVKLAEGKPDAGKEESDKVSDLLSRFKGALCYPTSDPAHTFVVRRSDRMIWVHLCIRNNEGGLAIIETKPLEITASLLPASELKQQLDDDGKVAVQVNFAVDRADILPDSAPQIEQIVELLKQDPQLELSVNGHTDNTGDADHNLALSKARARSVADALIEHGIDDARLESEGFGSSQPVAENDSASGKAANRRVELAKRI